MRQRFRTPGPALTTLVILVGCVTLRAQGALSFTDITVAAGMSNTVSGSHGAFWADATGDGRPDLYLTYNECRTGTRANRFYRNLGGVFVEEAGARGIANPSGGTHGGAWVDLDNDGDYDLLNGDTYATDCIFGDPAALPNKIFRNDGGSFVNRTPPAMLAYADYTRSILGFDMDRDGDLDIFAVNGDRGDNEPIFDRNELYRNDGGLNFTAITASALVSHPAGQAGADTDYDGDGDVDILLPNFGGFSAATGQMGVLNNDGNGNFTAVSPASIGIFHRASTGISSGDLNNDGRLDLILIDQDRNPLRPLGFDRVAFVYLNAGGGTFTFSGELRNFGGFTAGLADLDNDGDLDLTIPGLPNVLLNDGNARFTQGPSYPTPMPPAGCVREQCMRPDMRTVSFADVDEDGDLDSVVTVKFGPFVMIRNNFNGGNWLKVQLTSAQGQAGAFGAKVRVFRAGTTSLIAMREAKSVYGYLSQDDPVMHVGLGPAQTVDVDVTFLDGSRVTRRGVSANQTIAFVGATTIEPPATPRNLTATVVGSTITLTWDAPASGGAPSSYQLEAGSATGLSDLAVLATGLTRSLTASAPNGTYYVRVRARNAAGTGPASNEIIVIVGGTCLVPNAPAALAFTRSGSLVTLTWSAPAGGSPPAAYVIEVGSRSGVTDLVRIDTGGPTLTLSASAPPGRYFVRVKARNACGSGPASNEVVIDVGF